MMHVLHSHRFGRYIMYWIPHQIPIRLWGLCIVIWLVLANMYDQFSILLVLLYCHGRNPTSVPNGENMIAQESVKP